MKRAALLIGLAFTTFGCEGTVELQTTGEDGTPIHTGSTTVLTDPPGETPDEPVEPEVCAEGEVPAVLGVPTRLLTQREYNNALERLFPNLDIPEQTITFDGRAGSFVINSRDDVVADHIREFRVSAESVASIAADDLVGSTQCNLDRMSETECVANFVPEFASKAFRRPATQEEQDALIALYTYGAEDGGHVAGMRYLFEAMLQSPSFIYVYEAQADTLSGYEVAQRMAHIFERSVPDEALLNAAKDGTLLTSAGRVEHARRLLASNHGQVAVQDFVGQWFGVDRLMQMQIAGEQPALIAGMALESERFVQSIFGADEANYVDLLTADYTIVTQAMADHYGYDLSNAEDLGDGTFKVQVDSASGLLTQGSFLTQHHGPVHRGLAVRVGLMCGHVPGPDEIDVTAIPTLEGEAERSKSEKRLEHETCGGCHLRMDPVGLAFDTYGDLGQLRTEDKYGNPVRSDGELTLDPNSGVVSNAAELGARLAESENVQKCVTRQLFIWSFGRQPEQDDVCTMGRIQHVLENGNNDLREALVGLVASDEFVRRKLEEGAEQ